MIYVDSKRLVFLFFCTLAYSQENPSRLGREITEGNVGAATGFTFAPYLAWSSTLNRKAMLLQNIRRLSTVYMALCPRRYNSSGNKRLGRKGGGVSVTKISPSKHSDQHMYHFLKPINRFVFVVEMRSFPCDVRTEFYILLRRNSVSKELQHL